MMMSCSHFPGTRRMARDVVIHGYTFMSRTLRAVSFIINQIKCLATAVLSQGDIF